MDQLVHTMRNSNEGANDNGVYICVSTRKHLEANCDSARRPAWPTFGGRLLHVLGAGSEERCHWLCSLVCALGQRALVRPASRAALEGEVLAARLAEEEEYEPAAAHDGGRRQPEGSPLFAFVRLRDEHAG